MEKTVYLTFDDGPHPQVTPWILDRLAAYGAKGTFFCVGANAETHPDLLKKIRNEKHQIGNHTHRHLNGWQVKKAPYLKDVETASEILKTPLFRPPYGKITPAKVKALKQKGYQIIMWDILTYDFDPDLSPQKAINQCLKGVKSGSILVFHDNPKAFQNLKSLLPALLDHLSRQGYQFQSL